MMAPTKVSKRQSTEVAEIDAKKVRLSALNEDQCSYDAFMKPNADTMSKIEEYCKEKILQFKKKHSSAEDHAGMLDKLKEDQRKFLEEQNKPLDKFYEERDNVIKTLQSLRELNNEHKKFTEEACERLKK